MKRICKLVAVLLAAVMLLTGCSAFGSWMQKLLGRQPSAFSEMEYLRPDMDAFRSQLDVCITAAAEEDDVEDLMDEVYELYEAYYLFSANYKLANIYFCKDVTDEYWSQEYNFCMENTSEVDAGIDKLLYALADSPLKEELEAEEYYGEGYFDDYTGESLWDETFTELMAQDMKLQSEYDALSAQALEYSSYYGLLNSSAGRQLEELLVEMVVLRQEIAQYAGYDNYLQFAYEFYYSRDYAPEQAMAYMDDVRRELVDVYLNIPTDAWSGAYSSWSERETLNYVKSGAQAMGGTVAEAFAFMEDGKFYDISYGANKYDASFETYLHYYSVPYIFVNPQGNASDPLTFAHEFGHFCNDYASSGTICSIDVAEVFSQGMEYLSLFYADGGDELEGMKMASSLSIFVEQSAYASFEHKLYLLDNPTVEKVRALYAQTAEAYGFGSWNYDSREYITITHLYIAPVYMVSYVISNDVAMQIYQAEAAESGAGRKILEENLATEEVTITTFVDAAGLTDPFVQGRVAQLRETFEKVFDK